jgi:molybdenum storage protein
MGLIREHDGKRLHVKSKLMGESLVSRSFMESIKVAPQQRLFPDVNVIKIGGQSICDRGIKALPAIIREIADNKPAHKMLLATGGGTRSRHIYTIGLELGMPTGIIAKFGSSISEQNALLVATLLAPWGGIKIGHDEILKLPNYFAQDCIPVIHGMPPYDYFAIPAPKWRIPIHRTDVGALIVADLIGAKSCIFVKDEKGLYTGDPKKSKGRLEFIARIGVGELIARDLDDLIIERPCLEILQNSEVIDEIRILNGLEAGNLTRALQGEPVGTIIFKE